MTKGDPGTKSTATTNDSSGRTIRRLGPWPSRALVTAARTSKITCPGPRVSSGPSDSNQKRQGGPPGPAPPNPPARGGGGGGGHGTGGRRGGGGRPQPDLDLLRELVEVVLGLLSFALRLPLQGFRLLLHGLHFLLPQLGFVGAALLGEALGLTLQPTLLLPEPRHARLRPPPHDEDAIFLGKGAGGEDEDRAQTLEVVGPAGIAPQDQARPATADLGHRPHEGGLHGLEVGARVGGGRLGKDPRGNDKERRRHGDGGKTPRHGHHLFFAASSM
jgi:hypothetical protein